VDRNLFLAFALSFAVLLAWTLLVEPPRQPETPPAGDTVTEEAPAQVPAGQPAPLVEELAAPAVAPPPGGAEPPRAAPGRRITIETPLYEAELDSLGGALRGWKLRDYHAGKSEGGQPVGLVTAAEPLDRVLLTPLVELGLGNLSFAGFEVAEESPRRVAFRYASGGVVVEKIYSFEETTYQLQLELRIENGAGAAISPHFGVLWPVAAKAGQDFKEQALAVLHEGSLESEPLSGLGKPGFFGGGEPERTFQGGVDWVGMNATYFVAAVLPDQPALANAGIAATQPGVSGVALVRFAPVELPPGAAAERVFRAYLGPKEPERLEAVGGGLVHAVDIGWAWMAPLTRFFGWLLHVLYTFIPNYGLAIIVLTVLVRLVTTPLTAKQMRSMERMRALAPKLQELKEKYGDDRQKQSEEMMRLYRNEGVNPLGGCFPMLLQLPVFIGLFYALRSSIQLRQAPFVGWIDDLSAPETLFVIPGLDLPFRLLPLVMGATMVLQQKITPMQQMDPTQQRMMMVMMPLMMTVVSFGFPSGLVLYWMVSNVLAIAHQLWVGRGLRRTGAQPASPAAGNGDKAPSKGKA
jgi:YidC/Oxa1 family membrane protein insertase